MVRGAGGARRLRLWALGLGPCGLIGPSRLGTKASTRPLGRVGHVVDPAGVLWHIARRRDNGPMDQFAGDLH